MYRLTGLGEAALLRLQAITLRALDESLMRREVVQNNTAAKQYRCR
jgi:hypothetical protein